MTRKLLLLLLATMALHPARAQTDGPQTGLPVDTLADISAEVDSLIEAMRLTEEEAEMRAEVDSLVEVMMLADLPKPKRQLLVRPQQVIVPAAFLTLGAVAVGNPRLCRMKQDVRDAFQRARGDHRKANVETWVTLSAQLLTVTLTKKGRHDVIDRMLVKASSYALLYATMPVVRACVREKRPDGHSRHSFPSFKTANAFMAAEQVRIEHGWAWGMGMYTVAAGVGVLQMYNDRAYLNDVLAGAGMGLLAVHGAYWLLPLERKWLKLDKTKKGRDAGMLLVPTYDPLSRTAGFAFTASL